jgi:hypothetical protein
VQLHQPDVLSQLAALDAQLVIVSFAAVERLQRWVPYFRRRFLEPAYVARGLAVAVDPFARTRFLADPIRAAYHAYGLGRNSVWRVYGPRILAQYARWGLQGKPIRVYQDTLQRGGNFVIGPSGRLMLAHTGRDQAERPSVAAILAALRQE